MSDLRTCLVRMVVKELLPGSGVRRPFAEAPSISNLPPSLSPFEASAALQQSNIVRTSPTASYSSCWAFHHDNVGPPSTLLGLVSQSSSSKVSKSLASRHLRCPYTSSLVVHITMSCIVDKNQGVNLTGVVGNERRYLLVQFLLSAMGWDKEC